MGVLHPDVLSYFGLHLPASVLELNVEPLLHHYLKRESQ